MAGHTPFRLTFLLLSGLWLAGCIPYTSHKDDPYFAGYHRADPSQGVTVAITDREALIPTPVPDQQPSSSQPEAAEAPTYRDYTYQDWNRSRYYDDHTFRFNLSYHLYGPYYYRDLRSRYWNRFQRRWHQLPWYAGGWYGDPWWDYPYGGYGYGGYDRWYDPWYGFYDPWYYDPYRSYGYPYSYYGGFGWRPWYGTYATGPARAKTTQRRSRNRSDLPIGLGPESGGGMTGTVASQSGQSQSESSSTGTAKKARQEKGSSSTVSGRQARSSGRQGSYTTTRSRSRSSSSVRRTSSTPSSRSGTRSKSTKTARTRGRKP